MNYPAITTIKKNQIAMKTSIQIILVSIILFIIASACNPVRRTTSMLAGEWRIENFEEQIGGTQGVVTTNIGTITLNEDRTGKRLFSYSIMGLSTNDTTRFTWLNTANSIILDTQEADNAKLWIITDIKKNSQTWMTTDGKANMQTMKLSRVKE
jgi:hypothetical protein